MPGRDSSRVMIEVALIAHVDATHIPGRCRAAMAQTSRCRNRCKARGALRTAPLMCPCAARQGIVDVCRGGGSAPSMPPETTKPILNKESAAVHVYVKPNVNAFTVKFKHVRQLLY